MQVKDITDEQVYTAIRTAKQMYEDRMKSLITNWDKLSSTERIQASGQLLQMKFAGANIDLNVPAWHELIDAPFKVVWRKGEKMVDEGKLNYGTSLNTAWIEGEY